MIALKIRSVNIVCSIRFAPLLTHHNGDVSIAVKVVKTTKY